MGWWGGVGRQAGTFIALLGIRQEGDWFINTSISSRDSPMQGLEGTGFESHLELISPRVPLPEGELLETQAKAGVCNSLALCWCLAIFLVMCHSQGKG